MKTVFFVFSSVALLSCSNMEPQARTPVPPKGSDYGDKAWNDPSIGPRPGGPLADMMEGR